MEWLAEEGHQLLRLPLLLMLLMLMLMLMHHWTDRLKQKEQCD
jgi:hypothetical protein